MKPFTLSYIPARFGSNKLKDVQDREVFNYFCDIFGAVLPKFWTFSKPCKMSSLWEGRSLPKEDQLYVVG
jgi:hypothetical protein